MRALDVASRLGFNIKYVKDLRERGYLNPYRDGSLTVYLEEEVEKIINEGLVFSCGVCVTPVYAEDAMEFGDFPITSMMHPHCEVALKERIEAIKAGRSETHQGPSYLTLGVDRNLEKKEQEPSFEELLEDEDYMNWVTEKLLENYEKDPNP